MLARPIVVLVLLASALGSAVAWYAIDEWSSAFAYRAAINPAFFLATSIVVAAVAFVTVAAQSLKAASADPVKSLRHG
jgi:putative ABC transport system permease protein